MTATDDPGGPPAPAPAAEAPPDAARERRARIGLVAGIAITVVALAAAIAFGLSRTDDPGRVAVAVVALHDMGPTSGRPATLPDAGVPSGFSDNAARAGWTPTGSRSDRVEGRSLTTAFWERRGRRIAHTVVSGDPVEAPARSRRTGRRGLLLQSFDRAGRTAVIWTEGGHTAVISGIGISRAALYALAGGPRPPPRRP
jgi:hypothetical protein